MAISVECPACGAGYRVKDELDGRRMKCKSCGESIRVSADVASDEDLFDVESPPPASARAKRRKGKKRPSSSSVPLLIGGGLAAAVLLLLVVGGGYLAFRNIAPAILDQGTQGPEFVELDEVVVPPEWQRIHLEDEGIAFIVPRNLASMTTTRATGERSYIYSNPGNEREWAFGVVTRPLSAIEAAEPEKTLDKLVSDARADLSNDFQGLTELQVTKRSLQGRPGVWLQGKLKGSPILAHAVLYDGRRLIFGLRTASETLPDEQHQIFKSLAIVGRPAAHVPVKRRARD